MSLFENNEYRWRETFFVLFEQANRPTAAAVQNTFDRLGSRYELLQLRQDEQGRFESATVISPYDYAAMDVSYVGGEEVRTQIDDMLQDGDLTLESQGEAETLERLRACDARFDVYHFERIVEADDEGFLDPGGLLIVLEKLAQLCQGVAIDPQSGTMM